MTAEDTRTLNIERSTSTAHRLAEYDGVCNNIHGHNMKWEVSLIVDMTEVGDDNMPLDFKEVSDLIDETDHATLLNENDPIVDEHADGKEGVERVFGDVIWFDGDPTCELISQWMADRFVDEIDTVFRAEVSIAETDKYTMSTHSVIGDE